MTGGLSPRAMDATGASYFDGDVPQPRGVTLALTQGQSLLEITLDDGRVVEWPLTEVRALPDISGRAQYVLRWTGDPLARLVSPNPFLLSALPQAKRRAPPKGRGRLIKWAVAAVAAVALQIFVLVPLLADNMAKFIPIEGEKALGEATFGHIREALDDTGLTPIDVCTAEAGTAALNELVTKISGDRAFRQDVTIAVLDHEMVNAFALPGGFVVLFRGLIEAADGPDEVAAVVAHEIGHVISRDPTRHALRSAGSIGVLGLLFGDFAGGAAVLFLTERLIAAQYSQAAETAADIFAHEALEDASISPAALGRMFENLQGEHGDRSGVAAHFLTHPAMGERIRAARAAVDPDGTYFPSMPDESWAALQNICK
ncbi:M48 family metallopeptidase [Sulfitobacter mediterraneus]|uniref:Peptidase M48-like protein n=1 Tax=Sulfitobacter mediterraneus TaxID=83219 RepID=A0A2T6CIL9_9RHOB|nr:M48 family metallopeptidase [Sulfitobacter mediterraneus]PTX75352.1 peptidase M48-like protein [Sulfitobacter mediterraneus]